MRNLHKLYYKDYFSDVDFADLKSDKSKKAVLEANQKLTDKISAKDLVVPDLGTGLDSFQMEVLYPGLITGVGIQHEASIEGEFKLGLHLDYTTGLPIIYGSTVKGVLRSYFEDCYMGPHNVDRLIDDIFGGNSYSDSKVSKSIYDRDIFYDAVVIEPAKDSKVLASDALAPHGVGKPGYPLIDPNPVTFVKVAAGVKLLFRFRLVDTKESNGKVMMSVADKLQIFKTILATYGIGAKTNVGYGQLK